MKTKIIAILLLASLSSALFATAQDAPEEGGAPKMLIAYFSWSENGNTRTIARMIQTRTDADLFEIVPEASYPRDHQEMLEQAKTEISEGFQPALQRRMENIRDYDIIFVGSPNWWSTIAPPVATFLATHDLSGKIIFPFMTHGGSILGRSLSDIKALCPDADVRPGLAIRGRMAQVSDGDVDKWLEDSNITE